MQILLFSIYDAKAELYCPPFTAKAKGEAIRMFIETVNDGGQSTISKYPEDFTLFHIGTYDDTKGKTENLKTPLSLGLGLEFQTKKPALDQSQLDLIRMATPASA